MQGRAPHLYTVEEERERQTGKETGRDKEIGRTDRREQGQGLVNCPCQPSTPPFPVPDRPPLTAQVDDAGGDDDEDPPHQRHDA